MKPKVDQDMIQALIGNLLFVCLLTYKWKDLCSIESFIHSKSMEFGIVGNCVNLQQATWNCDVCWCFFKIHQNDEIHMIRKSIYPLVN